MAQPISKSSLTGDQRRLIELLQDINFGRIEHLQVRDGEPAFEPPPNIIQARKMGVSREPREEAAMEDFWLRASAVDLIQTIREIGDGEILSISISHGLPHLVEVRHRSERPRGSR